MEIEGTVAAITKENNNGHTKKVLTLITHKTHVLFVEFQGKHMQKLEGVAQGDKVAITVYFNGKVSHLGRRYNNIIGRSIQKLQEAKPKPSQQTLNLKSS